jgi:hypothetical protein
MKVPIKNKKIKIKALSETTDRKINEFLNEDQKRNLKSDKRILTLRNQENASNSFLLEKRILYHEKNPLLLCLCCF